jgi:hypothetical protein
MGTVRWAKNLQIHELVSDGIAKISYPQNETFCSLSEPIRPLTGLHYQQD